MAARRKGLAYFEKIKLGFAMARLATNKTMPMNTKNIQL